jgi:hypothetical protein
MSGKHTPGPWTASEMGVISDKITSHGNFYVCGVINADNEEDKANMKLIAAAPDLLAALQRLLQAADEYSDHMTRFGRGASGMGALADSASPSGQARAAIAKAKGGAA